MQSLNHAQYENKAVAADQICFGVHSPHAKRSKEVFDAEFPKTK
jgi:hypothetical protein